MTEPTDSSFPPPLLPNGPAVWEDFVDIFTSPSEVFERRRYSGFAAPLFLFAILTAAILLTGRAALQPIFDAEFSRSMALAIKKNPAMAANMDSARSIGEKIALFAIVFVPFVTPLLLGVVVWVSGKFVSAKETIAQACMIASYALIPRILDSAIRVAQAFFLDPASMNGQAKVSLSAGRFLDPDVVSPGLVALASRIDVFVIWSTILIAIGLSVVARIQRARAYVAALIAFVIATLPAVWTVIRT